MKKRFRIEYLIAVAMFIVCCGAEIYDLTPFGTSMFCALASGVMLAVLSPIYLLCAFLFTFEVWRLYAAGAVIVIISVRWFLGLKFKRCDGYVCKTLFYIAAIVVEAIISALFIPVSDALLTGLISAVFLYFAVKAASVVQGRCAYRLGVTEAVSVCMVFLVAGLAFGRAQIHGIVGGIAPAVFVILLLDISGHKRALAGGAMLAVGMGFNAGLELVPAILLFTLAVTAFDGLPRVVYCLAGLFVFAATHILFGADIFVVLWSMLCVFCGALPVVVLPRRAVRAMREYFDYDGSARLAVRHYINRTRSDAGDRMLAVASVFDETARLLNVMGEAEPDFVAIGKMLSDGLCPYCPKNSECEREKADAAFTELAKSAHEGKSVLAELPEFFARECARTVDAVSAATGITEAARESLRERESENKAKTIVTERLAAIKDVLSELGNSQAQPVGFDGEAERRISAELNNNGIPCAEAFCTRSDITAIVRTEYAAKRDIEKTVSAATKRKYEVASLEKTQAAGWSVATLKRRPAYEAAYARVGVSKSGVSGDSYTFKRIGDKFLTALLDGMGAGERASESSGAAVELIECFYRAGFDSKSVLVGVNRFLKLPTAENYSAADVVVCDLDSASVDIIKIGAPPCYIKTLDTVLKIEGSSLPIGVLDEMRPTVTTKRLYPGQMLMLVTDGVSDCFRGDELPEYINGLSAFNPETAANAVLSRALALSGGVPKDDMTVIAFRLFMRK